MSASKQAGKPVLFCAAALAAILFSSCPNLLGKPLDLEKKIQADVTVATASVRSLEIASSSWAVVSPSGAVSAKDGIPVTLSAVPFTTHSLVGWRKTGGSGTVVFSNATATGIQVTVKGGNASIEPVLVDRPTVLYSTPIGNNIAKNSKIAIIFSRPIDFSTVNGTNIKVLKNGNLPIDGIFQPLGDGRTIRFLPDDDLSDFANYVISISTDVKSLVDRNDPALEGTEFTGSELYLPAVYTTAFRTGNNLDIEPPLNGAFTVADASGDTEYTRGTIVLSSLSADDDAGIAFYNLKNSTDADYQTFDINDQPKTWSVTSGSSGTRDVMVTFTDSNGLVSAAPVTHSMLYDPTPPTGSFSVDSAAGAPGFVGSSPVSLTLSAVDPDVETGIKGSGESTNGSDTANRKQMRIANNYKFLGAVWEPYSASRAGWAISALGSGTRTVYVQFRDGIGNLSPGIASSIYLDLDAPAGDFWISGGNTLTRLAGVNLTHNIADGIGSGLDKFKIEPSGGLSGGSAWTSLDANGAIVASGFLQGDGSTAASFTAGATLTVALAAGADGNRTINLRAYDKTGNSVLLAKTLTLDTTAPTGGAIAVNGGAAKTNSTNVTINVTGYAADALSGTTEMGFSNNEAMLPTVWLPVSPTASWTLSTGDGEKNVYVWFRDAAGNYQAANASNATDSITLDTTPPAGTVSIAANPTGSSIVTLTNTISGATGGMRYSNDNSTWSGWEAYSTTKSWNLSSGAGGSATNGTRYVYCQFSDGINITALQPSVLFDDTAPTGTVSINSGAEATKTGLTTLAIACTDNIYAAANLQMRLSNDNSTWSGWIAYTTSLNWYINSGYGGTTTNESKKVYIDIKDPLGNTRRITDAIYYDTVVPLGGTPALKGGAAYTNVESIVAGFSVAPSDAISGVSLIRFSNNNSTWSAWETYTATKGWDITSATYGGTTAEGTKTVYYQVQDRAGNLSAVASDTIVYDVTAPTGYLYIESGNPATSSWSSANLYFYVTDNLSGVAQRRVYNTFWSPWEAYTATKYSWYLTPGNGTKTVYAQFVDGAGNYTTAFYDQVTLSETYSTLGRADIAWDRINLGGASSAYMSTAAINGNDPVASSPLAPGSVIVYCTSGGLFGKMSVVSYTPAGYVLTVNLTTFNADGTVHASAANLNLRSSYSYDLDTCTETATGADFKWNGLTSTTRNLLPYSGAYFFKWN